MNYIWGAVALVLLSIGWFARDVVADRDEARVRATAEAAIAQAARQETAASEHARAVEKAAQGRVERLAQAYDKGLDDAEDSAKRTIAKHVAGESRMRQHWQACIATDRLSNSAESAARADEARKLQAESLGRIDRILSEADAKDEAWRAYGREVSK